MRNKNIWIFNATNDFMGNVKYMFLYVNEMHPEIEAIWMCDDKKIVEKIKGLGYEAFLYSDPKADVFKQKAGVFVVHQVKQHFPALFNDEVIILNLWHGVGLKPVERYVDSSGIKEITYRKYIKYNNVFRNNQLFLVSSPFMEEHFRKHLKLEDHNIIRGGYPANKLNDMYKVDNYEIDTSKKVVLYTPTFRDYAINTSFSNAIPNFEKLKETAEKNNLLIIFKMHYLDKEDAYYQKVCEMYKKNEHFIFWDNKYDVYEIFDKIDAAIIDYSSIYYDMLTKGIKFIRYIYDYDQYIDNRPLLYDYKENTSGEIVKTFDELIDSLENIEKIEVNKNEQNKIKDKFWNYSTEGIEDIENIFQATMCYEIQKTTRPKLYSFDIFDTILQRKTLNHVGIYFGVGELAKNSQLDFPKYIVNNYPRVRHQVEQQIREYYKKSHEYRKDDRREIQLAEITDHMQVLYHLTDEQRDFLFNTEVELEIQGSEPKQDKLDILLDLVEKKNEKVILISDMYLPEDVIRKMLDQVHPKIRDLDLFLSSSYGYQKTTKKLYLEVFEKYDYDFDQWIHYGDNHFADIKMANEMNIKAIHHKKTEFNNYEKKFVDRTKTYDSYLVSTLFARFREENTSDVDYYSYAFTSAYFVPYIHWCIKDGIRDGLDTLYFISRDGHTLKYIADAIIKEKGYDIKTKYIYGSRKAWRIPSFINEIDEEFYSVFGSLQGISNFQSMLDALCIDEEMFDKFFPSLEFLKRESNYDNGIKDIIKSAVANNKDFNEYLIEFAKEKRETIIKYFNQEIDFNEKFAFVEYWGRGYTQTCMSRILEEINPEIKTIFYYARSIYPTHGNIIRKNYTAKQSSLIFVESLFNNIDHETVTDYELLENGNVIPVFKEKHNDKELYYSMKENIQKFVTDFYSSNLIDTDEIERDLYDFAVDYFHNISNDKYIVNVFSNLKDSVILYEKEREYAPKITVKDVIQVSLNKNKKFETKNMRMSLAKSSKPAIYLYNKGKKIKSKK